MKSINYLLGALFLIHPTISTALTTVTMNYYNVSGNTTKQLHDAITINSPTGTAGLTEFKSGKPKFEIIKNSDGKFVFKSATINQNIVITLPKWNHRSAANECVIEQWDNAIAALKKHEKNHSKLYQELENRLNISASKLLPHDTKEELYGKVQRLFKKILMRLKKNKNYTIYVQILDKKKVLVYPLAKLNI